jgi:hypothetical protein
MKTVRIVLLLIVLVGLGAMVYFTRHGSSSGSGPAELRSKQADKQGGVRVEEKYGITSEQVGP